MNYKDLIDAINKDFGKNTVVRDIDKDIDVIPTGCIPLDIAIGVGGIPVKRITEYYGGESSGKTTMALQTAANCQAMGKTVVYIDAEHALDIVYAANLGVNLEELIIIQPDDAETGLEIVTNILEKYHKNLGLVIVDSVAAMIPKAEADSEVGDASVGLHARLMSSFIRRVTPLLNHTNAALLLINQQRAQIGGMAGFGAPGKTTPGGHALKHGASLRIEFARTGNVISKEQAVGIKVAANIKKNKVSPPYQKVNYEIEFGKGTSLDLQIVTMAIAEGIIKKSGSWYAITATGESIGQGMEKAIQYLIDNGHMYDVAIQVLKNIDMPEKALKFYTEKAKTIYHAKNNTESDNNVGVSEDK